MKEGLARTGRDPGEAEPYGPGRQRARRTRKQEPRINAQVTVRVATSADREGMRRMLSRASSETIHRRFHAPYRNVPERVLALMVDGDHRDAEALVAVAEGEIVGHAMYARLGVSGDAEMAIIVEDGWQSRGVGKLLLRELAERARVRSVETFVGTVLLGNRRMLGLISAVFGEARHVIADGAYQFHAPLWTLETADPARTLRSVA